MPLRTFLMSTILTFLFSFPLDAADVWKVASLDWEPYSDSQTPSQGSAIATLRGILKQAGIELVVEFYPWQRAKQMAGGKNFVGYFPAWHEEVIKGFVASSAVAWSGYGVVTYKGSGLKWKGLDDLFTHRIGIVPSYIYSDDVRKQIEAHPEKVDITHSELSLAKKLSSKRFKAAISGPEVMHYIAKRHGINNLITLHSFPPKELVLAFRDGPDNRVRIILFEELLKQYFATPK
ncbi:substrate-binding periplasmic protein [Maridesulfovibrio sp.]|uniref:substrate-binding periplasmic protein n=1 Tax=Maridesulfovibrio sp. TaxID=2795000 RepID=UPI003B006C01